MPSPIGHALAGLTTAWLVQAAAGRDLSTPSGAACGPVAHRLRRAVVILPAVCVVLAVAPDFDLFLGNHRMVSHSLGAALVTGLAAAAVGRWLHVAGTRVGIACGLAVATHVILDWLGSDSSTPQGVMALWPFSSAYTISGLDWFSNITRRYWFPREFVRINLHALARELVILVPVTALAWRIRALTTGKRHR